ncbi:MAG: flagellar basal body protein FliL [Alphaproteobacteria bacterium]|nr:flagellar basal body protein FliL [Alphaproteobacteria bacterium]|tara:strand:- start:4291 stop:4917 length:627 start_codon:yes stop_codon:yes gene_type:complete
MADEDLEEDKGVEGEGGDEGAEGADASEEEGDGKKKLIIAIVGVIVLLLGVGAGLYFTGMLDGVLGKETAEHVEEGHGDEHGAPDDHGAKDDHGGGGDGHGGGHGDATSAFVVVPTMNISLNSDDGVPRYLRLSVQLELKNPDDAPAVEAVMPRVIDRFQTYLRELRVKDLRGSGGIYRLQMELLWRVNQAAAPVEVKDVLFQEILVQ